MSAKPASAKQSRTQKKGSRRRGADEILIPDKLYFRIGEVARLCRLPAYVLRFWETEFPQLKPGKSSTGQRMYRRSEVEYALRVKNLLYAEGFTIPGARQQLATERKAARAQAALPFAPSVSRDELKKLRQGLKEILGLLASKRS